MKAIENYKMKTPKFWFPSLKAQFAGELAEETAKYNLLPGQRSERLIEDLPPLMQQHLRTCGYAGKESVVCCRMIWKNTFLKFKPKGRWVPLEYLQINFVPKPARLVLMQARIWGFLSFGARDKYQDGKGSMLVRLLDRLPVSDDSGKKMDRAELVTILAETIILPVYALQAYTTWETIDPHTVKGTIRDGDTVASGLFHFNEQGQLAWFETTDRYYMENGQYQSYHWTASVDKYICRGDLLFPSSFKATWRMPGGDYDYFRGELVRLEFNSTDLADTLNDLSAKVKSGNHTQQQQDAIELMQDSEPDKNRLLAVEQAGNTKANLEDYQHQRITL